MGGDTCPVTRNIPLMTLPGSNSNTWHDKSHNDAAPENSDITANQTTNNTAGEKENEPSKRHESFVVFIGHYENEFEEWPELRPEFADVGYYGVFPPKTAPGNHADHTGNAGPNGNGIPTTKDKETSEPLREDNYSKLGDESWPSENSDIGIAVLLDESSKSAPVDTEPWFHPVDAYKVDVNATSSVTEIPANGTMNQGQLMCSNQPVNVRHWMQEYDNGICEFVDLAVDKPLKVAPVKNRNDKWMRKIVINESVMCRVGSKSDQVSVLECLNIQLFQLTLSESPRDVTYSVIIKRIVKEQN